MAYTPLGQGRRNEMFNEPLIKKLGDKYHKTPTQIMLRFFIEQNIIVIPKSVHLERIKENIDIFDFKLEDKEIEAIKRLDKNIPLIGKANEASFIEIAMKW